MRQRTIRATVLTAALALALALTSVPALGQTAHDADVHEVAQDIREEIQTESFQFEVPEIVSSSRTFVGGGGPSFWGAFFDLAPLEAALNGVTEFGGGVQFGDRPVYLLKGGAGFGGRRIRMGGAGGGGSWTSPVIDASAFDRATLDVGMGGFQIESVLAEGDGFGLSLGAILGRGNWSLTLTRNVGGSFSEVATQPTTLQMDRSFWFAMPFVSAEYRLLPFFGVRFGGGMGATLSFGDWEVNNGRVAPGGPLKNALFPMIQVTFVFGG